MDCIKFDLRYSNPNIISYSSTKYSPKHINQNLKASKISLKDQNTCMLDDLMELMKAQDEVIIHLLNLYR